MRAFHYCRVSTKEQGTEDHYSLDNQEQRCRDYTQMKRWRCSFLRKDIASGKLREECLKQHWFKDIEEARVVIEEWLICRDRIALCRAKHRWNMRSDGEFKEPT